MTYKNYNHITQDQKNPYRCRTCLYNDVTIKYETILNEVEESGYELLTKNVEYKNGSTTIKYICPKHGVQKMRASNFHNGRRCPGCKLQSAHDRFSFSPDEVYKKVSMLGGELLNKDEYINQDIKNLKIVCPRCHDNIFTTSLKHFCQHGGQSCPECYRKESVGERRIRQWLTDNNIEFIQEKWFGDCRDKNPLPFDFYIPHINTIIEFDGQQHFKETHFFSHSNPKFNNSITSYIKYHDNIKTDYCISNNINLIRIPYTEINNIENILEQNLIA